MTLSLIYTWTCATCGHQSRGFIVRGFRVNKKSVRSTNMGLGWLPKDCKECKSPLPDTYDSVTFGEDDREKVNAYRVRHGWPVIEDWRMALRYLETAGDRP